jgi:hypothetical protein
MHAKMVIIINGSLLQPLKAQKLVLRAIISGILKEARHHTHKHSSTKDYLRVHLILIEVCHDSKHLVASFSGPS